MPIGRPKQVSNQTISALRVDSTMAALVVHSVDASGAYVSPGAGSTQVSIKEILSSSGGSLIDSSNVSLGVTIRAGSAAGTEYTDGDVDVTPNGGAIFFNNSSNTMRVVSTGTPLPVTLIGASAGGTALADQAAFSTGTTQLTPIGGVVGAGDVVAGKAGAFRMSSNRALWTHPVDSSGGLLSDSTLRAVRITSVDAASTGPIVISSIVGPVTVRSSRADALVTVYQSSRGELLNTVYQSSASELLMTATIGGNLQSTTTQNSGSSGINVRIIDGCSSAANFKVLATLDTALQSTAAPSSNSSGVVVRVVVDGLTTFASSNALASTVLACQSSAASVRYYVTAYTITSTNQTPAQWGFYSSNGTLLWPMTIASISSAVSGANLAVGPPGYLFRTATAEALNFKTNGSTVTSVQLGVSFFTAP